MKTPLKTATRSGTQLDLETLELLPCGCVSASYRAMPWAVELVRVEARGAHCLHAEHAQGSLLGLPDPQQADEPTWFNG